MIGAQLALFQPAMHRCPAHFEEHGCISDRQKLGSMIDHSTVSMTHVTPYQLFHTYVQSNISCELFRS